MAIGNLKDRLEGDEIDLSLCNLASVPVEELADVPEATHLDLSCNLLVSLPVSFCTLTHLVKLDLSKNRLTELPQEFGQLVNLQHLDLLGNELVTLPSSFRLLHSLTWLDLKGNPLDPDLRERAGDCLDEKQCQACAQNVLVYMKKMDQVMEKGNQNGIKGSKLLFWLFRFPAIIIVVLTLAVSMAICSSGSIRNRLHADAVEPVCTHVRDVALRIVEGAGQLWHSVCGFFL